MEDWINCDDHPLSAGLILIWDSKRGYVIGEYCKEENCYYDDSGTELAKANYWTELPERPE